MLIYREKINKILDFLEILWILYTFWVGPKVARLKAFSIIAKSVMFFKQGWSRFENLWKHFLYYMQKLLNFKKNIQQNFGYLQIWRILGWVPQFLVSKHFLYLQKVLFSLTWGGGYRFFPKIHFLPYRPWHFCCPLEQGSKIYMYNY